MRGKYSRRAVLANGVYRLKPGSNLNRSVDVWEVKGNDSVYSQSSRLSGLEMAQRDTEDCIKRLEADIKLGTSAGLGRRRSNAESSRFRSSYQG